MKIIFKYQILYAVLLFVSVDNIAQNYGQYEKECDARCKYEKYMKKQKQNDKPFIHILRKYFVAIPLQ